INLYTIRDDSLLGTLKFISKIQDYQQYGALIPDDMINQDIKDSKAYKTYYDIATGKVPPKNARKYKKVASPSRKLPPVLEKELAKKPKKAKKPVKKSTTMPIAGVVIRDTPGVLVSKKKSPSNGDRGKGMDLLFDATLLEAAQVLDESQDKTTGTNEGTGTKPGVPDVPKYSSESENESWGDSGDDDNDDDINEVTKDDDKDDNDDEEEEKEEEVVCTPNSFEFNDDDEEYDELYKDGNMRSKVAKHEEKTEGSKQSSSISSDFASKFLKLDNAPPVIDEVASMINVKTPHVESSTLVPPLLTVPVTAISKTSTIAAMTVPPIIQSFSSIPQK
ncbi:hypothetical protein Tco_1250394, partial [Tanacetum coccineum]